MTEEQQDVFYYITVMNENYAQPALPAGCEEGIIRGMYRCRSAGEASAKLHVQLMGSGTILREVLAAQDLLAADWGVASDAWSVTSFNELRRDGLAVERYNRLHPTEEKRASYVEQCLEAEGGAVIAATDYMKLFAEQIRQWVPVKDYKVLGTDGFGRSDSRKQLRHFFEVDRHWVVITALQALVERGELQMSVLTEAMQRFGIDADKPNPLDC